MLSLAGLLKVLAHPHGLSISSLLHMYSTPNTNTMLFICSCTKSNYLAKIRTGFFLVTTVVSSGLDTNIQKHTRKLYIDLQRLC